MYYSLYKTSWWRILQIEVLKETINEKSSDIEELQQQNNALLIQAERLKSDSGHFQTTIARLNEEAEASR